jgi:hypothetical protein
VLASLACGTIVVWEGENMFWFTPSHDLGADDLPLTVIAFSIASGVGLGLAAWGWAWRSFPPIRGRSATFPGGAEMG